MTPSTTATEPASTGPGRLTEAVRIRRIDLGATDDAALAERRALVRRGAVPDDDVRSGARRILADVRSRGPDAVREANKRYGGGDADGRLLLERADLQAARDRLDVADRRALDQVIDHVARFAAGQRPRSYRTQVVGGIEIERRWLPLDRVGCYVPGGSVPYPSSLVMTVVPAKTAGVGEVIVATPADASGVVHPVLLGAAGLLEVDAVLVAGGAQAVGALAFGWPASSIDPAFEPVDRIVGPGNPWVTAAKLEVVGVVGIDLPAGPSEGMVLADDDADPLIAAADLVTQAEHGPDSPATLVTTSPALADAVEGEVAALVAGLERRDVIAAALSRHGLIAIAPDANTAIAFVDGYAPEHLSIHTREPEADAARIRHAGSIFVGAWAPESAGDYATGANHVLPTGGLARACDPLAVEAFGRWTQIQHVHEAGLAAIRETVGRLASVEGLTAHRHAVEVRFGAGATDAGKAARR